MLVSPSLDWLVLQQWMASDEAPELVLDRIERLLVPTFADHVSISTATRSRMPPPGRSCLTLPLIARGQPVGTLALAMIDSGRALGPAEQQRAEELAYRLAL